MACHTGIPGRFKNVSSNDAGMIEPDRDNSYRGTS
jgi:hypothetical protein